MSAVASLRYFALVASRSRQVLAPLIAFGLVLLGVYAYRPNEVGETWALTALLAMPLCLWLVAAVLGGEPEPSRAAATAAMGGRRAAHRQHAVLTFAVATLATVVLVVYPLAIGAFDRPVLAGDIAAGAVAHLVTALLGGQLGTVTAPPVSSRQSAALVVGIVMLLISIVVERSAPVLGGPAAVSAALADSTAGAIGTRLVAAAAVTCLWIAAAVAVIRSRLVLRAG